MPRCLQELQPLWKSLKNLAKSNEKICEVDESSPNHPYKACILLRQAGIPCKVWGNDTQAFPGILTEVADLYILVPDPERASQVLKDNAYIPASPAPGLEGITQFRIAPRFVSPIPAVVPAMRAVRFPIGQWRMPTYQGMVFFSTVLLPAADWGYSLAENVSGLRQLFPRLHEHFECTVEKWLDCTEGDTKLRRYLAGIIACEFEKADEFRTACFKNQVRKEHWQLLFDIQEDVADLQDLLRRSTQLQYRDVKNRTLQGEFKPTRPYKMEGRIVRVGRLLEDMQNARNAQIEGAQP
ncbi:uncharacterized protein LDX57_003853 [Aspergillus melleus]|uniref:uncharacterized protein n=1 Tax=Aspergillus melleus TaxID=138277 RepID=UPI001E8DB806|nr:uncharacterized protein LDX57_003853 [Aspergillus melleus]KAH8426111.1 hypothetical protein LDX57_003853 [Aspergillus melleus]